MSPEEALRRAVTCLYIAVDASVADDIKQKVEAVLAARPTWRTEKPTQEGWYWFKEADGNWPMQVIEISVNDDGQLIAAGCDLVRNLDGEWAQVEPPGEGES